MTVWDADGAGPGEPRLVAAGSFSAAGDTVANFIAAYDAASGLWSPLGSGMNGTIGSLAVLANGELVAGGSFTSAGGVAANRIARWNGSSWSAMGSGTQGVVYALTVLPDGDLAVGGSFRVAGGIVAPGIARWGCEPCAAEFNGDGVLDVNDFFAFLTAYSIGC